MHSFLHAPIFPIHDTVAEVIITISVQNFKYFEDKDTSVNDRKTDYCNLYFN